MKGINADALMMMMVVGEIVETREKEKREKLVVHFLFDFLGDFVFSWRCSGKQLGNDLVENATTTTTTTAAAAAVQVGYIEGT